MQGTRTRAGVRSGQGWCTPKGTAFGALRSLERRRGLTLVEVLVVLGIIGALVAILVPTISWARESARVSDCRGQLRQLATALAMYADDHDGYFPLAPNWDRALVHQLKVKPPIACPGAGFYPNAAELSLKRTWLAGYAYNKQLEDARDTPEGLTLRPKGWVEVQFPSTTVAFCDAHRGLSATSGPDVPEKGDPPSQRPAAWCHRGGANYAFVDRHVKWYRPEAVESFEDRLNAQLGPQDGTRPSFVP